jgi:ribosome maturation factor RimP
MKLSAKTQALYDLIEPAVAACGVALWGIEFLPQGKRSLLRIFIDRPVQADAEDASGEDGGRGIGVEDCTRVTHQVNGVLDVHDPIAGEYTLEVSSPGWDRPFFTIDQLKDYVGQTIALRLIAAVENRRKFNGTLVSLENDVLTVSVDGQQFEIDADNIDKANLVYQD